MFNLPTFLIEILIFHIMLLLNNIKIVLILWSVVIKVPILKFEAVTVWKLNIVKI